VNGKVLVIGAAGMIGRKLVARLRKDGAGELIQQDVVPFADGIVSDLSSPGEAEKLIAKRPDLIFHLAAIVSGEAEADFEKGYRVNLDGTRYLFEAVRKAGYKPRIVFTSSIAVFGAPFPEAIGDEFLSAPLTSYGTQKAIDELLLADYSRRGIFDGIGIRLPTICVRPGKPNKAASGFFSGIIREPLAGQEAVLPVPETVRHWFASPRAAIDFLVHAAELDTELLGTRRNLSMPGLSATVAEQIESLRRVAGEKAARLIRREPDQTIMRIVEGWPRNFDARRALSLGFRADASFDDIIRIHLQDELGR
jgi:nucleoside-diphosphate-sugar epimerase